MKESLENSHWCLIRIYVRHEYSVLRYQKEKKRNALTKAQTHAWRVRVVKMKMWGLLPVESESEVQCWRARVVKVKTGGFVQSRGHLRLCVGELGWLK